MPGFHSIGNCGQIVQSSFHQSRFGFSWPESRSGAFFCKFPVGCHVPFNEEQPPHSAVSAALMICTDVPSVRFSHLWISFIVTTGFLVTCLTKALHPRSLRLAGRHLDHYPPLPGLFTHNPQLVCSFRNLLSNSTRGHTLFKAVQC